MCVSMRRGEGGRVRWERREKERERERKRSRVFFPGEGDGCCPGRYQTSVYQHASGRVFPE